MKVLPAILAPLLLLASCKKEEKLAPPPTGTPVTVKDPLVVPVPEPRPVPVPVPVDPQVAVPEDALPAIPVDEEEPTPQTPGEHVDHAIQKTDEGIRKAADATGRFLQRAGERIEDKAQETEQGR